MSPYSSLNNTGTYDNFGGGGTKALVGVGYDNVTQVDTWLSHVEHSLDQTEYAVQQRAGRSGATVGTGISSLTLKSVGVRGASEAPAYGAGAARLTSSRTVGNNIENLSGARKVSHYGAAAGSVPVQRNKNAILRSQTNGGSLQRSQSLGRGQLASSLANLKARLGSRGSSRERMRDRFTARSASSNGYAPSASIATSSHHVHSRSSLVASRERGSAGSMRRPVLKRTVSEPAAFATHHHHHQNCGHGTCSHHNGHHQVAHSTSVAQRPRSKSPQKQASGTGGATRSAYDLDFSKLSEMEAAMGASEPSSLCQCPTCNRTFNPKALEKHMKICQKVFQSKRPKFSSQDARLSGLEKVEDSTSGSAGGYGRYGRKPKAVRRGVAARGRDERPLGGGSKKPKWKQQSEQFRAAMMAARGVDDPRGGSFGSGAMGGAAPVDDGLIPCPHCGRTFNETAAERHIERCKDMKHRPKTLKAGGGRGAHSRQAGGARSYSRSSSSSSSYRF